MDSGPELRSMDQRVGFAYPSMEQNHIVDIGYNHMEREQQGYHSYRLLLQEHEWHNRDCQGSLHSKPELVSTRQHCYSKDLDHQYRWLSEVHNRSMGCKQGNHKVKHMPWETSEQMEKLVAQHDDQHEEIGMIEWRSKAAIWRVCLCCHHSQSPFEQLEEIFHRRGSHSMILLV